MSEEKIELKSYKVLQQIGWNRVTYFEGDTIQLEPRFAEFYIKEKVLEEKGEVAPEPATNTGSPQALPPPSAIPAEVTEAS